MSATAAIAPPPPPPAQSQHSSMLSLSGNGGAPLNKRPSQSPPSVASRTPVPAPSTSQAPRQVTPPRLVAKEYSTPPKVAEDHNMASPAPVKLPESALSVTAAPEPVVTPPSVQPASTIRSPTTSPNNKNSGSVSASASASEQTPAQLALLLSHTLADADALRRELSLEKKRAARAERLLAALQPPASPPNSASTGADARNNDGRLPESVAKAVVDAEARAEQAERVRDEALHAVASLSACFAELERYEAACALRASDARSAYSRLLSSITAAHPAPQSSPSLSTISPRDELRLNLPRVPAPLPQLPPASQPHGPGNHLPIIHTSAQSSRHARPLPLHSAYASAHSPIDGRQTNAFDSLPLPPPPSASGLGSLSTVVPSKRSHSHRGYAEDIIYEEQKRRRLALGGRDTEVDMGTEPHSPYAHRTASRHMSHHPAGPASAQPLSAYPTAAPPFSAGPSPPPSARVYDRPSSAQYAGPLPGPGRNLQGEGASSYIAPPSAGSHYLAYDEREREYASRERDGSHLSLGRVDARELVRDAKARERRGREREPYVRHPNAQAQSQTTLHADGRRRRSVSRSSIASRSSMSLDEMLLETATDRDRGRPSPSEHSAGFGIRQGQTHGFAGGPSPVNGVSASYTAPPPPPPPASHPIAKAPSVTTNGMGRKSSVPVSQLMTLGPSGTIVSGGGDLSAPAAVDPAVRYPGLRTCRQCGMPGRYKEGKCVEKWGPGPQGPGTVCDRCRKKMKRVERRGTLDSSAQNAASTRASQSQAQRTSHVPLPSAHSQSYSQSYTQVQTQGQSNRSRAPARTDTLIVDSERHPADRSRSPGPGTRYHASVSGASTSAAARHSSLSDQAHYTSSHSNSQAQSQAQTRRALTPPYINSIPSHEQYGGTLRSDTRNPHGHATTNGARRASRETSAEGEDDLLVDGDQVRERAPGYAHSYARQTLGGDERDELVDDADVGGADPDADADADGSGVGSADAEAEPEGDADADIMDAVDATMKVEE